MDIKVCLNRQYKSLSVLPGIDVLWYMGTITIMFVFLFWEFSIHFSAKNTKQQLQPDSEQKQGTFDNPIDTIVGISHN